MNIVFLHGFPFNASAWQPQLDAFKDQHRVFAPDLRGHRNAERPPGPWMLEDFAEDLEKYMMTQDIPQAVICGLSMGGYIALNFALNHSSRVIGLVLCSTRADADSNEAKDKRRATVKKLQEQPLGVFAKDFAKMALSDATVENKTAIFNNVQQMILGNEPENMAKIQMTLAARRDETSSLSKIQCPTAVIVGTDDKIIPAEVGEGMARNIAGAKFYRVENAGHLVNYEQPELFNQHFGEFLRSIKPHESHA